MQPAGASAMKKLGGSNADLIDGSADAADLSSDDEEGIPEGWHIVKTTDNVVYYWNEVTDETSWSPPPGYNPKNAKTPGSETPLPTPSISETPALAKRIEVVPEELIRREGPMSYKIKRDFGGLEPKKAHSWHSAWAVVCVGYLILYKDEPAKLKKKSVALPLQVVNLEGVVLRKEAKDGNRKNLFSIQSRSGAVTFLQPPNESEVNDWISIVGDSTKENSTAAEYENGRRRCMLTAVQNKLFAKPEPKGPPAKEEKFSLTRKLTENLLSKAPGSASDVDSEDNPSKTTVKNRLNNFFSKIRLDGGTTAKSAKDEKIVPEAIVFGGTLENLAKVSGKNVPLFIQKSVEYVEASGGLESQGIYRLSGNASTVQKFRTQLNQNNDQDLYVESMDVNVIAALVKLFFREIQTPVIPFGMYSDFISVMKIEDYNSRLIEIKNLVQKLPKVHYDVLDYLMRHLVKVAAKSEVNKMEPSNLAIVFGPSLIRVEEKGDDMQSAYANMMNMSFQNALVENMITQTEVDWPVY
ncbi:Rho GTPase-activating protein 15 [Kappamyces sp. JEL0680]|nr:Rho GTPase-activating protein 15 [Kappamyces sp. JEL0680]